MNTTIRTLLILVLLAALSGCAYLDRRAYRLAGADSIEFKPEEYVKDGETGKQYVFAAIARSRTQCEVFIRRLYIGEGSFNSAGDIVTATLTAAATVVTPLTTVHVLTGLATVATATKGTVNNEFWAKSTADLISAAIDKDYGDELVHFQKEVNDAPVSGFNSTSYLNRLQVIHQDCSLPKANARLRQAVAASPASTASAAMAAAAAAVSGAMPSSPPASSSAGS